MEITKEYLRANPNRIFVYGDNQLRKGKAGAAKLRDEPNTYGFITKRFPSMNDKAFYTKEKYRPIMMLELRKLVDLIEQNRDKDIFVSRVGSGLANKYGIYDMIKPELENIAELYDNVILL